MSLHSSEVRLTLPLSDYTLIAFGASDQILCGKTHIREGKFFSGYGLPGPTEFSRTELLSRCCSYTL